MEPDRTPEGMPLLDELRRRLLRDAVLGEPVDDPLRPVHRAPDAFRLRIVERALVDLRAGSGRGLREQLEHALRAAIQQRRLAAGTKLPATRVLAAELGISLAEGGDYAVSVHVREA